MSEDEKSKSIEIMEEQTRILIVTIIFGALFAISATNYFFKFNNPTFSFLFAVIISFVTGSIFLGIYILFIMLGHCSFWNIPLFSKHKIKESIISAAHFSYSVGSILTLLFILIFTAIDIFALIQKNWLDFKLIQIYIVILVLVVYLVYFFGRNIKCKLKQKEINKNIHKKCKK